MKKVSLVIPVYNEAGHLQAVLDKLYELKLPCQPEFVIVDDCSKDGSWEIIEKNKSRPDVIAFRQPQNAGKGAALHRGFELATGDIILVQDADFEYDPDDLPKLIQPLIDDKADVVFGSRFRKESAQVHRTFHYLINRFLTILSNLMSGLYLSDMETCYKIFRADIIKNLSLEAKRFGFEPEVTAKIAKLKLRMREFPISYYPRTYQEGKKINWKDGVASLWFILKFNLRGLTPDELRKLPPKYIPNTKQWL